MLEQLLESKQKNKILAFFLTSPERGFLAQELKRKIGGSKLPKELAALVKEDVLVTYVKKGSRYYRLNDRGLLYGQLRSWSKKLKKKGQDEVSKLIKKLSGLRLAILTGVFVSARRAECDVLLVGKSTKRQLEKFEKEIERIAGQEVNYAVMDYDEFKMRKDTFDRFMKDIFENDHVVLLDKTR